MRHAFETFLGHVKRYDNHEGRYGNYFWDDALVVKFNKDYDEVPLTQKETAKLVAVCGDVVRLVSVIAGVAESVIWPVVVKHLRRLGEQTEEQGGEEPHS